MKQPFEDIFHRPKEIVYAASDLGKFCSKVKRAGQPVENGFKKIVELCPKARKHLRLHYLLLAIKHNKIPRLISRLKPIFSHEKAGLSPGFTLPISYLLFIKVVL